MLKYFIQQESLPKELYPDPGSNTESPEADQPNTLKRTDNKCNDKIRKVIDRTNIIHPLNFSASDLQNSPKASRRNLSRKKKDNESISIAMKELTLAKSPVKIHKKGSTGDINTSTLKRVNDTIRETKAETKRSTERKESEKRKMMDDIKFADESSESSNEIKFVDDDTPDSNKLVDKFNVKV